MDKLDHEIDAMRHEVEKKGHRQAEERWQARVEELRQSKHEDEEEAAHAPFSHH